MKYAVIIIGGKQVKVSENQVFDTAKLTAKPGEKIVIKEVLLRVNGAKKDIGTPLVSGAQVTLEVISHGREPKIRVATYKAKSRSRKVYGHKQPKTTVKVLKIS